jgi:hypothetical protein
MFEMFIGFGMVLAASALGDRTSAMEPCVGDALQPLRSRRRDLLAIVL